jgi:DNA gyrase subunit A
VINNRPKVFTLKQMISHFIDHRKEVVVRRTRFELEQARQRAHILEGLVIALDNLDAVIKMIRQSPDPPTARDRLMSELGLTQVQAQAILDMRLHRLTGLERDKIVEEYRQVLELIKHLEEVLASEGMVLDIVVEELQEIRDRFADKRRTEIVADTSEISIEDLIAEEEMVITVSRGGYIKRTSLSTYRAQRRGGRGRRGMTTKQEDFVAQLFVASTHDTVLFFTSAGRVFARKVHELPEVSPTSAGRALVNLLQVENGETVETLLTVTGFLEHETDSFLVFSTRFGKIKRTALSEYANIRSTGLRAVAIGEGDELLSVHLTNDSTHIFMGTHDGMGIRFPESEVRPMGRVSAGVRGIRLRDGDWVEEVATVDPNDAGDILVVTDLGYGKRTPVSDFRLQGRSGYGMTLIRLTEKNGSVVGIRHVHDDDQILLVSEKGMLIRMNVEEISRIGRATQGVRLFRLDDEDRVVALAKLVEREDESEENGDNGNDAASQDSSEE